jgi:hypothetical protein
MWDAAERHPVRAWFVFVVCALLVVDGGRRSLAGDATSGGTLPLVAFLVSAFGVVPLSVLARRREFNAVRTQVLLALAFVPIILAIAAAGAGAALWVLWLSLVLGVALAAWWAWDTRQTANDGTRTTHQPAWTWRSRARDPRYAGILLLGLSIALAMVVLRRKTDPSAALVAGGGELVVVAVIGLKALRPWTDAKYPPSAGGLMLGTFGAVVLIAAIIVGYGAGVS